MNRPFSGAITAVATPFKQDDSIDYLSFISMIEKQKNSKISGVVVAGTTGENPTLTIAEKITLLETALNHKADSFKVYIGAGTNSTAKTIEEIKEISNYFKCRGNAPDGVMVVMPYYNKPTQQGIFEHFKTICKTFIDINFCVYNVPARTSSFINSETFAKLLKCCPNIVAIKDAAGCLKSTMLFGNAIQESLAGTKVSLMCGNDIDFVPSLLCGADGVISVTSNLFPAAIVSALSSYKAGNMKELQKFHRDFFAINNALFTSANPMPLKWALKKMNLCGDKMRLPLTNISEQEEMVVDAALKNLLVQGYN